MNERAILQNTDVLSINVCAHSVSVAALDKQTLPWRHVPPMFPDIEHACKQTAFPELLHGKSQNELQTALQSASQQGRLVQVFIDEASMFTHAPYFAQLIIEWFAQHDLSTPAISVIGVPRQ